ESFLEATHIARNQENYFIMSLAQTALGKIHVMKGRYKSALSYLMEGELAAKKNNTIFSLSRSYKAYIDYYKAINSFDQALAYQERLMELNEQLSEGTKISSIENIYQKIFEKENQNLLLEKQAVLQKNSWVTTTTGILSSMFIFILVGGWKRLRLIKKDRVKIEKHYHELTKSNALLQKDVSVRTTQLKEVNQTLDNFIYRTSHDIRGPLATLKGLSQTAQMEEMDVLAKEYFKKFNKMTHNLDDVLTRLQDASMIKHKQLSFETVNICEIVNNCIESNNTKSQYEEIKVEKEFNGQCEIISDKGLVHVSIEQLIDNAYKFFDFSQGKEPYIRIETAYKNKGINVKIIDNGIGIPKDSFEKIFNLFERASDRTGTGGIGLYLVKQALDRIGGTIGVKSSPGERFTEFEVFFPSHA
ncbi:MAG: HAMP domain-containing histidine kinase, partial [Cyclobacteriaceae bacterium]|nr:HAMP domain-containing histidine kinase [Cyclobacteriaceae bacterium]